MMEPFAFYRAVDPVKGSWDGYGFFPIGDQDFLIYVADAPSGASIQTTEWIRSFWSENNRKFSQDPQTAQLELADAINRLQDALLRRARQDGAVYQATLAVARKLGPSLFYCSVGDSTMQILRNGRLYRLSEEEVWDGALIIENSTNLKERRKTSTTQMIGSGGEFIPVNRVQVFPLRQDDQLLLSTDGMEELIPPDRLLAMLSLDEEQIKKELDKTFTTERLKDDVTFLKMRVLVSPGFDAQKEIDLIHAELKNLREDLAGWKPAVARIESSENLLKQISQQMQSMRTESRSVSMRNRGVPESRIPRRMLLIAVVVGLVIAAGFIFIWVETHQPSGPRVESRPPKPESESVAPPEIPANSPCAYVVEKGDTLLSIASRKNFQLQQLLDWNPGIQKETVLQVGQKINLCEAGL